MSFSKYVKIIGIGLVGASAFLYGAAKMSKDYKSPMGFNEQLRCLTEPARCTEGYNFENLEHNYPYNPREEDFIGN